MVLDDVQRTFLLLANVGSFSWLHLAGANSGHRAAPLGRPSLVSRLTTAEYYQRQCNLFFPPQGEFSFGSAKGKTAGDLNVQTEGWMRTNTTRVLWVNG